MRRFPAQLALSTDSTRLFLKRERQIPNFFSRSEIAKLTWQMLVDDSARFVPREPLHVAPPARLIFIVEVAERLARLCRGR
jgi:hypothetical protein